MNERWNALWLHLVQTGQHQLLEALHTLEKDPSQVLVAHASNFKDRFSIEESAAFAASLGALFAVESEERAG